MLLRDHVAEARNGVVAVGRWYAAGTHEPATPTDRSATDWPGWPVPKWPTQGHLSSYCQGCRCPRISSRSSQQR